MVPPTDPQPLQQAKMGGSWTPFKRVFGPILAETEPQNLETKPSMLDVGWGILAKPLESLKNRST